MPEPLGQRIIVALDGSEAAGRGLTLAASLAAACRAHVEVVTVLDVGPGDQGWSESDEAAEVRAELRERVLEEGRRVVREAGVPAETRLLEGPVVEVLLAEAGRPGVGMLIVGRTGHGPFKELVEGRVFRELAGRCPVPLTVVG